MGWLPFWLERLDEHCELMPEQAPGIDRPPSEYFLRGGASSAASPRSACCRTCRGRSGPTSSATRPTTATGTARSPTRCKLIDDRDDLTDEQKAAILAGNPARLYKIPVPASNERANSTNSP